MTGAGPDHFWLVIKLLSAGLLLFSFAVLVMVYAFNRRLPVHLS